jgi:hypothetical protein
MNAPAFAEQLTDLAATPVSADRRSQAYLTGFVKSEWDKWEPIIRVSASDPIR